jgi:hypothetical protein
MRPVLRDERGPVLTRESRRATHLLDPPPRHRPPTPSTCHRRMPPVRTAPDREPAPSPLIEEVEPFHPGDNA